MRPQVGQVINNKYRLLRLIGDGGMGSVYEARHEVLGTSVALKFLHPELSRREGLVKRFLQEAKVSAQIQSPHVVRVTDVDQSATGQAFIVLEYLEGKTLQTLYEDLYREGRRLSYADALEYAMQMLEGVEAAHRTGIVHRDLKPDNVMITKGAKGSQILKLLDFGIAKLKVTGELDRGLTRPGVIMGTPEYMAPEQAYSADAVDARADIFSLGVMIFEMLAGRRPVGGDDPQQIASAYLSGQVSKLADLMPGVAPELAAAVQRAMAPLARNRFDSVSAFRDALEPFAQSVRPPMPSYSGHPSQPSHPGVAFTPAPAAITPHTPPAPSPVAVAPATNLPMEGPQAVPKTLPPEADESAAPAPPGGTPLGGFGAAAMQPWPGAGASPAAGNNPQHFAAGFAPTEPREPYQPNGGGATNFASPHELSPRPSGTAIGGPGYDRSGTAPMSHPYGVAPTAPAPSVEPRRKARGGPPLLLILMLAGGVASAVVGGVYAANRYAKFEDHQREQDLPPVPAPTAVAKPTLPQPGPVAVTPPTAAKPPPVPTPPKLPTKPNPNPNVPGPNPQPSGTASAPPPILPSTFPIPLPPGLPTTFPIPLPPFGQLPPQQPPAQQDPPQQPPGGTSPSGDNPSPGGNNPSPPGTGRRPGGIILIPRHR
jgi:serine/threonine protein kinase